MRGAGFLLAIAAIVLSGCAGHTVSLVGRSTGATAQNKFRIAHQNGDVSFTLGGEIYTGHWVYVEGGGSIGLGTVTSFSGIQTATTTAMIIGVPTSATGTFLGVSDSSATLRCSYSFSQWNLKGLGICQDSKGETYDLQIY